MMDDCLFPGIKTEGEPDIDEPAPPTDNWNGLHPQVISSYKLDSVPGNTGITTYNGGVFDVFDPKTWVFDRTEVAQALSNICRFGGHVNFYSVAEHCVRVCQWLSDAGASSRTMLLGLMHDAVEAYIGDIVRPIKKHSNLDGRSIIDIEKEIEHALFEQIGLVDEHFDERWALVKQGDMAVYAMERDERPNVGQGLPPYLAKDAWLATFNGLIGSLAE